MKCIKCNYTSFDFNQTCPKCGKNLSAEAEKLHLPSYEPSPPYLLTSLTGETGETGHSLGNEQSGGSSFLETQKEDLIMPNEGMMINSPEVQEENSQDDGDNDMLVALDELSFEYEPATEDLETLESSQSDNPFMPDISQEEVASSTDPILFDERLSEDTSLTSTDKTDQSSGIDSRIEESGVIGEMEKHFELDVPDIDKSGEHSEETDELLISLEELSFEQEPVAPDDSPEQEDIDEDVLSISKLLDFGEETSEGHIDSIVETDLEDQPVSGNIEDDPAEKFESTSHSEMSRQAENVEDYIKLDLSDIDQAEDGIEDSDTLFMSFEEDGSEKALLEEDEISFAPNILNPEEIPSEGDNKIADLFSDQKTKKATTGSKGDKAKMDTKEDHIKLDILELEEN